MVDHTDLVIAGVSDEDVSVGIQRHTLGYANSAAVALPPSPLKPRIPLPRWW